MSGDAARGLCALRLEIHMNTVKQPGFTCRPCCSFSIHDFDRPKTHLVTCAQMGVTPCLTKLKRSPCKAVRPCGHVRL